MAKRAIVRIGDPTSHGGTVLEGFDTLTVYGKKAAGVGHLGYCPACKQHFVIVAGAESYSYLGKNIALEGMLTSCGAVLLATQGEATVNDDRGDATSIAAMISSYAPHLPQEASEKAFNDRYVIKDADGAPLADTEYALSIDGAEPEYGVTDAGGHTHLLASVAEQHNIDIYMEG